MEIVNGNILVKFHTTDFTKGLYDISKSDQPLGDL